MSNDKLAAQLLQLKTTMASWKAELVAYSKWAKENDGVIDANEQKEIDRRKADIELIEKRIAQIEKAKGLPVTPVPTPSTNFFESLLSGIKSAVEAVVDYFDGEDEKKATSTEKKDAPKAAPKNKLGITQEETQTKLANFFAAFDKFTVVVEGTTVEVETPYYMNESGRSHKWDGNTVTAGKGSPKEVQDWLQNEINKGKIKSKDPNKLRQYLKDNKIGVDCSGFVSQALNHVADKDGDMDFEKGEDAFTPDATGSGTFTGNKFTKISPANVQVGDTLYFKNPKAGGVNHIRIVGAVRSENGVPYFTIYESAGGEGPRKMEWKYENGKLQEFRNGKWTTKENDTFYRWKELEMEVPSGGGAGQGQAQDNKENGSENRGTPPISSSLSGSVGRGGQNKDADVRAVQTLLNKFGNRLVVDGDCGSKTIAAIEKFQKEVVGFSNPDGRVDPNGNTWKKLNGTGGTVPPPTPTPTPNNGGTVTPPNNQGPAEEALSPTSKINKSVGQGGVNEPADVLRVKQLLNKFGYNLQENGTSDSALVTAIKSFQTKYRGASNPDGRVDAGGGTWNTLLGIGRIQGNLVAMSQQYGVEPAVILAIQQIESGGNGYLPDGRPKILFEGHVFWKQLQKRGKDPQQHVAGNENILYPSWDSSKYQGGAKEYDRLEKAKKIDEIAALMSASWGEFQIMGFNHATVGYSDVKSFVEAMHVPNGSSLKAVMEFCKKNNLLRHVQGNSKDWAAFARGYNGPGYAKNSYDVKLAAAYERYKNI